MFMLSVLAEVGSVIVDGGCKQRRVGEGSGALLRGQEEIQGSLFLDREHGWTLHLG